jgi:hypothetical protein
MEKLEKQCSILQEKFHKFLTLEIYGGEGSASSSGPWKLRREVRKAFFYDS